MDDTLKPIIDLDANSHNTQWRFSYFQDDAGQRAWNWTATVLSGTLSSQAYKYEGDHLDKTQDPASEMGACIQSFKASGAWKAGTGEVLWKLYHPAGIASFSANVDRYRVKTSWPTTTIEKSSNGTTWVVASTIATPASAGSWSTLAIASTTASNYKNLAFRFKGTVSAPTTSTAAVNYSACEVDDLTLALS